jgi:chemotaxis protein MotB
MDWLASHGVNPGQMTAQGYGEARPVAGNATAAGRSRNRRVEIVRIGNAAQPPTGL